MFLKLLKSDNVMQVSALALIPGFLSESMCRFLLKLFMLSLQKFLKCPFPS